MNRPLTTSEVAAQTGITRTHINVLVFRHGHLKPATQLPSGDWLWTQDEIARLTEHKASHKRGRPTK